MLLLVLLLLNNDVLLLLVVVLFLWWPPLHGSACMEAGAKSDENAEPGMRREEEEKGFGAGKQGKERV